VNPILADSSFFVALYNQRESAHHRCVAVYETLPGPLVTCEACVTEALHILSHAAPAVESILTSIEQASLCIPFNLGDFAPQIRVLMRKYRDTPCGFADACLIHMADQLDTGNILTLDSDFKHYRWRRNRSFRMLIPLEK
jgi:predicted nucleic acid-binding protein